MNQNMLFASQLNVDFTGNHILNQVLLTGFGVIALALLAQVAIPLPFSPVPITGQTFGILCLGLLYGRKLGLTTILSYIALGSLGMPLFAKGGSGILFFSPSGGYLIGYVFFVLICGHFAEKGWTKSPTKLLMAMLMGETAMYLCGLIQLSFFIPSNTVLSAGLYPFIIGDLVKMTMVATLLPTAWKLKSYL